MCNLEILRKNALAFGANDAKEILVERIPIEDEIIELCKAPLCEGFGQSAHCPPHVMKPEQARIWLRGFSKALVFKLDVHADLLLSKNRFNEFRKVYLIATELEKLATSHGCPAYGLAAGSCKPVFCKDEPCNVLTEDGECRNPFLARPSMEAIGINVFKLVEDIGWDIHRIFKKSRTQDIPSAMLAGLLLVSSSNV